MSMRTKYRLALPVSLGVLDAALMVWDIHNQRVIQSMGMAWDTGAPLWPYQTPHILFFALNTPAYIIAAPAAGLLGLQLIPYDYLVLFPCVILWWWIVGALLDRGRSKPTAHTGWFWLALSGALALILVAVGAYLAMDTFRWELTYGNGLLSWDDLIVLRSAAPAIWCFLVGSVFALFGVGLARVKMH